MSVAQATLTEIEKKLIEARAEWERRLDAIRADRRRENAPLEQDFEDQVVQRENDETLDALDQHGRGELRAIEAALGRIADGSFGDCATCGEPIGEARLLASPTSPQCVSCAGGGAAAG